MKSNRRTKVVLAVVLLLSLVSVYLWKHTTPQTESSPRPTPAEDYDPGTPSSTLEMQSARKSAHETAQANEPWENALSTQERQTRYKEAVLSGNIVLARRLASKDPKQRFSEVWSAMQPIVTKYSREYKTNEPLVENQDGAVAHIFGFMDPSELNIARKRHMIITHLKTADGNVEQVEPVFYCLREDGHLDVRIDLAGNCMIRLPDQREWNSVDPANDDTFLSFAQEIEGWVGTHTWVSRDLPVATK